MKKLSFIALLSLTILFSACSPQSNITNTENQKAKYVFLFIGDGMGISQMYLTEAYLAQTKGFKGGHELHMTQLPSAGIVSTYADNRFITGSAAAGTALASGNKTSINSIGMDTPKTKPLESIAKIAKDKNMKVGILSSVYMNHATPAAFYAHQPERKMLYEIGIDMANSDFDYFGGGGIAYPKGEKKDKEVDAYELAIKNGYTITNTRSDFDKLNNASGKIIAVSPEALNGKEMPNAIDVKHSISLAEFTQKGIDVLDNDKGFFMMIEGGKIDWACHSNDIGTAIQETIEFDNAVKTALDFYKLHPDETLIIVTADHETGGLTLGYAGTHYDSDYTLLANQKVSIDKFSELISEYKASKNYKEYDFREILNIIEENFGLGNKEKGLELTDYELGKIKKAFSESMAPDKLYRPKEEVYIEYGGHDPIVMTVNHIFAHKAGLTWGSYSHTAIPVPVFSIGVNSDAFDTFIDNTEIPKEILNAMQIK